VTALDDLRLDYRAAFLRYQARREESVLNAGYELGRSALAADISLLELVRVHHDVLIDVLRNSLADEAPEVAEAAADFLMEVLASYAMSQGRS
jgi:Phosphoserine phosphatase RsbU, N-terminal domain